jgi:O-antigen/teichoic acid export membrane protein
MTTSTARIAKNTLALYFRQILAMLAGLYTVRVVLAALGAEDYGIYNVAAGAAAMFGFLSGSMTAASQRYFSFEIGRGDYERLKRVFGLSLAIYIMTAVLVLALSETAGLWFVRNKLVIPPERKSAALWAYQFSIISFLCTILTAPYMAVIIAHEDMNIYAYVSIVETSLKLAVGIVIQFVNFDKLKLYGILMCLAVLIPGLIYRIICGIKYRECKFKIHWNQQPRPEGRGMLFFRGGCTQGFNTFLTALKGGILNPFGTNKSLFMEIAGYTGWNLFGFLAGMIKNNGTNLLLNIHFGPLINASRALASQVSHAVLSLAQNFSTASRPHAVKLYAAGKTEQMLNMVFKTVMAMAYLLLLFMLPLYLELSPVLKLWLGRVPDNAEIFVRILLVDVFFEAVSYPVTGAVYAAGKIKTLHLIIGGIVTLNLPLAILLLKLSCSGADVLALGAVLSFCAFIGRLVILSRQLGFPLSRYLAKIFLPAALVFAAAGIAPALFTMFVPAGPARIPCTAILSIASSSAAVFCLGLTGEERKIAMNIAQKYIRRFSGGK